MFKLLSPKSKHATVSVFLGIFLLSVCVSGVSAAYDDWRSWLEEQKEEAKEWWENTQRQAEEWWQETEEGARETWYETKEQAGEEWRSMQEKSEATISNIDQWLTQIRTETASNVERAVEIAKEVSGTYRQEAWTIIETEKRRQLCSEYNDPAEVGELERKRGILTEGTIIAIKLLPVYDEKTGKIRTYDGFARDMVNQTHGLAGSDLAADPVRCAALMLFDSDYLMYAKIIQTPNGKWVSIREAQECGYRTEEAVAAGSYYEKARIAYESGNAQRVEKYTKKLSSEITRLNVESEVPTFQFDPLWVLPFGVIAVAGATFVALEADTIKQDRKIQKNTPD